MKDIKSILNKLELEEKNIEKIGIFLKTKKGQQFVSNIYTASLSELCKRFGAPKFIRFYKNDKKDKNIIFAAIKKYNVSIPTYKPINLEPPVRVKCKIRLTKEELHKMNSRHPTGKLGFAERMHAYEEHMMNKFIAKHPAPTDKELAEDLFPEELKAGYKNMLYIRREHVRNLLCERYCKTTPKEVFYRVFTVLSVTEDPATGRKHEPVISEVEGNPYIIGYPFAHLDKTTPDEVLSDILARVAKKAHSADKQAIKVKLYNKYGTLLASCKCVDNDELDDKKERSLTDSNDANAVRIRKDDECVEKVI